MGREVRKVPEGWEHPKRPDGRFIPLFDGYSESCKYWDEKADKWNCGEFPEWADEEDRKQSYTEWEGERPSQDDYMPDFPESECTHFMMYENTSEGTPISPAFETPEQLARWLADNGASAFGSQTASYEGWLRVAKGGYACSAVYSSDTGIISGVDAMEIKGEQA